jgi:nucleotide-binding universal stress UspA family protein
MDIIRRDIGQITLAAGMIDDTIGWILLSVVAGMASSGQVNLTTAGRALLAVFAVLVVSFTIGQRFVSWSIRRLDNLIDGDTIKITALMVLALAWGSITHALGLEAVLGAFILGILMGRVKRFDERLQHSFQQITLGVFAPVFFAFSGLRVDLKELLNPSTLAVGLLVLAIAIAGKFVGAYVGAKVTGLGNWEAIALGAGMNARGAMEIIVATIGLSLGILSPAMYSIILLVAVVTSLMAPPLLRWTLSHVELGSDEIARLETEERRRESFVGNLKRVLLPTRGDAASQIAAQLVGLMVHDEEIEVTRMFIEESVDGDKPPDAERIQGRLKRIEEHFSDLRSVTRNGEIGPTVLAEAARGYDLLVLGATERRTTGGGPLFERFVDDIIQDSPCSLLIVSAHTSADPDRVELLELRHILVPVSGSEKDRYAAEVAFWIARDREIVVDVVHVVSASDHSSRVEAYEAIDHAVDLGQDLVHQIADLGHSMGATVHTDVLVADNPANAIVDYTRRRRADLVVLSSSRRPVSQRAFFGHSTDHVLRDAACPVAVVSVK